jgi:hypothetical protein
MELHYDELCAALRGAADSGVSHRAAIAIESLVKDKVAAETTGELLRQNLAKAEAWIASSSRVRPKLEGYTYRVPCDRVSCGLHADRCNGLPICFSCADGDGVPRPLYLAETPYEATL